MRAKRTNSPGAAHEPREQLTVEDAQHRHGALQIEGITVRTPVARDDEQHLRPDPVGAGTGNHPPRERRDRV